MYGWMCRNVKKKHRKTIKNNKRNEIEKWHLVKEFFPVVLCHESEEGQKSPAEGIKTGVAIVWIPPYF